MKIYLPVFLIVFLNLQSCSKDSNYSISPITSNIIVEINEVLEDNTRSLILNARTEKIYPCMNYRIATDQDLRDSGHKVTFRGIIKENICATAFGPAISKINLGNLTEGTYNLQLNNMELINKGQLIITDTEIKLIFKNLQGIEIPKTKIDRP